MGYGWPQKLGELGGSKSESPSPHEAIDKALTSRRQGTQFSFLRACCRSSKMVGTISPARPPIPGPYRTLVLNTNLVGGSTPPKNMKVSWDDEIPNIWKVIKHVPNHQPEINMNIIGLVFSGNHLCFSGIKPSEKPWVFRMLKIQDPMIPRSTDKDRFRTLLPGFWSHQNEGGPARRRWSRSWSKPDETRLALEYQIATWEIPRDCSCLNMLKGKGMKQSINSMNYKQAFQEPGFDNKCN